MAGRKMARGNFLHNRRRLGALQGGFRAAGMKMASRRRIEGTRHFTFQQDMLPLRLKLGIGDGDR